MRSIKLDSAEYSPFCGFCLQHVKEDISIFKSYSRSIKLDTTSCTIVCHILNLKVFFNGQAALSRQGSDLDPDVQVKTFKYK